MFVAINNTCCVVAHCAQLGVFAVSGIEQTGEVSGAAKTAGNVPVLIYCRVANGTLAVQAKSPDAASANSICSMLQSALSQ